MNAKDMVLCYVDGNTAYFTPDLAAEWGDDWNDAPYEHNAGPPYLERGGVVVDFEGAADTPRAFHTNSPWSVEAINDGDTPWLKCGTLEVFAGTRLAAFPFPYRIVCEIRPEKE